MPELQLLTKEILKPSWGTFTGSWRLKDMAKAQGNWSTLKNLMKLELFRRHLALPCMSTAFFLLEGMQMLWLPLYFRKYAACHKILSASMWFIARDTGSSEHFFSVFPPTIFSYKQYYQYSTKKHFGKRHTEQEACEFFHHSNCCDNEQLGFLISFSTGKTRCAYLLYSIACITITGLFSKEDSQN